GAFLCLPLLRLVVPFAGGFTDDARMTAEDGLAKHVGGADGELRILAGEIERLIGLDVDEESGEFVAGNADNLTGHEFAVGGVASQGSRDAVVAELLRFGDKPIGGSNAETRALYVGGEDNGVIGIANFEANGLLGCDVLLIIEKESAHVEGLRGLIDRLVGGEKNGGQPPEGEFSGDGVLEDSLFAFDFESDRIAIFRIDVGKNELQDSDALRIGARVSMLPVRSALVVAEDTI